MTNEAQQWQQFVMHLQAGILSIDAQPEDEFDYPRIHRANNKDDYHLMLIFKTQLP